jgi:predicted ATP-grasp superfamily ATP-dependent carboligase
MTEDTRPVGRPSLYDPSYCDKVVELGALGKSVEQISSNLGVSLRTMYTWRDAYPEFLHALDEAKAAEQTWWEDQAQAYMLEHKDGAKLNASIWSRSMAARFPKKYRESVKQEITGENGAPLLTNIAVSFVNPNGS